MPAEHFFFLQIKMKTNKLVIEGQNHSKRRGAMVIHTQKKGWQLAETQTKGKRPS